MARGGGNGFSQSWRSRVWVNNPDSTNNQATLFIFGMTHGAN